MRITTTAMETASGAPLHVKSIAAAPARRPDASGGRVTTFVILSSIMAASGGILFGYDIGISGGVTTMGSFQERFFPDVYTKMKNDTKVSNYCKFNSEILTTFTSSLYLAGLFASLFASRITVKYGRRTSMLVGGGLFLAGSAVGGAAMNVHMLILARILLGSGIGFTNQAIPLYLSEMSPPGYRGALTGCFDVCISFGILVANLVNYGTQKIHGGWGWRVSLSLAALPAMFLTVGVVFLPETPSSLIQRRGDRAEVRRLLQKIRGADDVDKELDELTAAVEEAAKAVAAESPFRKIFRRKYRPHLVMALALPFFQQVTGINAVNFYAPVMFRTIGQKESSSLMSAVITRVISLSCTIGASMLLVDRIGRRVLFITGGIVMIVSHVVLGFVLKAELHDHGSVSRGFAYLVLLMVCIFVGGYGWSWGPLAWLVTSEIFPLEIRSAGQSIQVAINLLSTFAVAQSVLALLCGMKAGIFFMFAGWVLMMTTFVFLLLPETKGVALDHMVDLWKEHWYWKRYVNPRVNREEEAAPGLAAN
ncbi:Hexose carrier protein HEX6 [Apostasia shenzhenica]|uniref:Hexose carrier protein HEX6 n=1 Tax=Apostasia shenzhenica TaxID=1088818 RepID=A0A2H9ZT27_9ASPA|nr:Hexose carrier protein HEX6 [Apostasia shenzhenica]